MPDYRLIDNGYVDSQIPDTELAAVFKRLKALIRDGMIDHELLMKGVLAIDALSLANRLTGRSFRGFVEVNYDEGRGPLAGLMRDVVNYLNGKTGHQVLLTSITIHHGKLRPTDYAMEGVYPHHRKTATSEPLLKDGAVLLDYDLYRLMAGIGAVGVARLFLLVGGADYYE